MVQEPPHHGGTAQAVQKAHEGNHPDIGGTEEAAKEINNEYDTLFAVLSRQEATQEQKGTRNTAEEKGVVLAFWRISPPPQKGSQFGRNPREIRQ